MATGSAAVVGAGVAGLGAAYALSRADVSVTVLEASSRIGGRVVTRRRDGYRYDTGANYITPADGRMAAFLPDLGRDGLAEIEAPVWTHDADGRVEPGDPDRQDAHRWTYESGIEAFPRRLADRIDAEIRTDTTVDRLVRRDGSVEDADGRDADGGGTWEVEDDGDSPLARADAVVLTPPAPETAGILDRSSGIGVRALEEGVSGVSYRTVVTAVLGYGFALDRPYYALVNPDRGHPIGWLSREEEKPGHVPDGESVLIVQLSPSWSVERYDRPAAEVTAEAAALVADLLSDDRLREPAWTDRDRFPAALPDEAIPEGAVEAAADAGLFLAGDGVVGSGRVSLSFFDGLDAGERIAERLQAKDDG